MAGEGPADYSGAESEKTASTNWNSIPDVPGSRHGRRTCKKRPGCRITDRANESRQKAPRSVDLSSRCLEESNNLRFFPSLLPARRASTSESRFYSAGGLSLLLFKISAAIGVIRGWPFGCGGAAPGNPAVMLVASRADVENSPSNSEEAPRPR
jgi:hypothetical protein